MAGGRLTCPSLSGVEVADGPSAPVGTSVVEGNCSVVAGGCWPCWPCWSCCPPVDEGGVVAWVGVGLVVVCLGVGVTVMVFVTTGSAVGLGETGGVCVTVTVTTSHSSP